MVLLTGYTNKIANAKTRPKRDEVNTQIDGNSDDENTVNSKKV